MEAVLKWGENPRDPLCDLCLQLGPLAAGIGVHSWIITACWGTHVSCWRDRTLLMGLFICSGS